MNALDRCRASRVAVVLVTALAGLGAVGADVLPQDRGAAGTWQKILKLKTTASAMHTTAHPDDEHGGMLARLSRGMGVRVSLMTLNRGESGDNAIGAELFDGLGLIRTEELLVSNRYYGVDQQYFTTVVDYGFSKRIDEAIEKWGRDNVLRDVVRVIRLERPFVLISRFQGNERDGHGNHQTAGLLTREAFKLAGDPNAFPDQVAGGLRPWQPFKVYIGGVRENEAWTVRIDPGQYSPWLGETYNNFARIGLSFQRSQNSGRLTLAQGPMPGYYARVESRIGGAAKEEGFFDGLDATLPGLFKTLGTSPPAGAVEKLRAVDGAVDEAMTAFSLADPSAAAPALARGLAALREAITACASEPEARFVLERKELQFMDAINAALGVELTALAQPAGVQEPTGPFAMFAPPPAMGNVVAGQRFEVRSTFVHRGAEVSLLEMSLEGTAGVTVGSATTPQMPSAGANQPALARFPVTVNADASPTNRPYFTRPSIAESRYTLLDESQFGRPAGRPALEARARYTLGGTPVEVRSTVRRREPNLPYGYELRELAIVPALALTVSPQTAIIPLALATKRVTLDVDVLTNVDGALDGRLALRLPAGWTSEPASQPFAFTRPGERSVYRFSVSVPSLEDRAYAIEAVATVAGREYRSGYRVIEHRDLETRYLYHPSTLAVRGIDVATAPGLKVGYVMGVGDQVPAGIAQLGYEVTLLDAQALATADLSTYDAIMTGTRAYAVREDLKTYNQRLLDYVKSGGNLVVLYNTQEFVPNQYAPFPAELPARAEEVAEEDSPVDILAPELRVLNWPNRITKADFDGWVEQRGSKFWSSWDGAYTAVIATWDRGQPPQKGGWLTARSGKGTYTYFAYAFHRQLPYGVPGAYRLLANVLALGK